MFKALMTTALLTACLTTSGCMTAGDFCDVVKGPLTFTKATAQTVVRTDRATAEQIETQNVYGAKVCGW